MPNLSLRFATTCSDTVRARIRYVTQVFCAVHGYGFVESGADVALYYGAVEDAAESEVPVPARYIARRPVDSVALPRLAMYSGEQFPLFFSDDGQYDWLGEAFEWISAADEHSIELRDSAGRIPFSSTIFSRANLTPTLAYAARLFAALEGQIRGTADLVPPTSNDPDAAHFVVASHDLDYYYTGRLGLVARLCKNSALAATRKRSISFLAASLRGIGASVGVHPWGDYIPELILNAKLQDLSATLFVNPRRLHPRDANYELRSIVSRLDEAAVAGFGIALHGSYTSIVERQDLQSERKLLERQTGVPPRGNRQHWLRFDNQQRLYRCVDAAGFEYDSSLGFSSTPGFRNGACFAFPPYDFEREQAYSLLEIPLTLMDASLLQTNDYARIAHEVMNESRRWGWGGISILWHDPTAPTVQPPEVNRLFWELLSERPHREMWLSAERFVDRFASRFHKAQLLPSVKGNAGAM